MNQARRFEAKPDKRRRQRRKERIIGWVSYISIAVVIQCFFIVCASFWNQPKYLLKINVFKQFHADLPVFFVHYLKNQP